MLVDLDGRLRRTPAALLGKRVVFGTRSHSRSWTNPGTSQTYIFNNLRRYTIVLRGVEKAGLATILILVFTFNSAMLTP